MVVSKDWCHTATVELLIYGRRLSESSVEDMLWGKWPSSFDAPAIGRPDPPHIDLIPGHDGSHVLRARRQVGVDGQRWRYVVGRNASSHASSGAAKRCGRQGGSLQRPISPRPAAFGTSRGGHEDIGSIEVHVGTSTNK